MKREFTVPITVFAYTKEEAQARVNVLLQTGAFFNDFNVRNLADSFVEHFLISKLSQFTKGTVDLSRCYHLQTVEPKPLPDKVLKRKRRQYVYEQD